MKNRQSKMRVLMFSWEYPPHVVGGLGAHVAALVPALARAGIEVHLVTPRWNGGDAHQVIVGDKTRTRRKHVGNAIVYRVEPPVAKLGNFLADVLQTNLGFLEQGHALVNKYGGFDLIHAHDWLVASAAMSLGRLHKTELLATIHATQRGRARGHLSGETACAIDRIEGWLAYEARRVICASRFMANEVVSYFEVSADKVDVVPNGVDAAPFDALEHADLSEFRAQWARPEERIVFFVGRLVHEKGVHLLVEAVPRIVAEIPQTRVIIAGAGEMSDCLKRRAWELGVADKVLIAGFVSDSDRDRLFKVADVAVFPSLYEPFGIVALEAMAARCPVVASSMGGLSEVVQHDVNGATVYPDNVESLAWGLLHTLRYPDRAQARAAVAYRMVKEEYGWDRVAARTIEVYDRIVKIS